MAISRLAHRLRLAYQLQCAREDARARNLTAPDGVWACYGCAHVSLDQPSFGAHLIGVRHGNR